MRDGWLTSDPLMFIDVQEVVFICCAHNQRLGSALVRGFVC
jgi:hypothetical protein